MRRALVAIAIAGVGIAAGVYSLAVARDHPAGSYAGASAAGALTLLGAGWLLVACGSAFWARRRAGRFGPLLAAAGIAWFLPEWNNPEIGSALAFTVGLCLYAACPPLAAHAILGYAGARLGSRLERAALAVAYAGNLLVLGVLPALVFDPRSQGCAECPRNLLRLADDGAAFDRLNRIGVDVGFGWALALSALVLARMVRARAARQAAWPVLLAGAAYLGLVAVTFGNSFGRGFLANGALDRQLWFGEAAALAGVAAGTGWGVARTRRARTAVARLVVELAQSPPPGGLQTALAGIVGDPALVLAYPLDGSERLVDAQGRPVEPPAEAERTTLVRDGTPVAVLAHAPGLLDDEQLVDDVTAASRLALENERLQADVRARLEELRGSRARIVAAGDAERKRLERDLHDGAQQRLVALSLSLRLLRSQLPHPDSETMSRLDAAESELDAAIAELRELAHGIFPAVLADGGLAVAVRALAEEGQVPIRIGDLPEGRFPPAVETAAYTVVAEAARIATRGIAVHGEQRGGALVVEVETHDEDGALDRGALEDRVGALDGRLGIERGDAGRVTILAELPCAS